MKVIIEHEKNGQITSVCFASQSADGLELQPSSGRAVVSVDLKSLGLPDSVSQLRGTALSTHQREVFSSFQIVNGKPVRKAQG
jgi:hypothetical protein